MANKSAKQSEWASVYYVSRCTY